MVGRPYRAPFDRPRVTGHIARIRYTWVSKKHYSFIGFEAFSRIMKNISPGIQAYLIKIFPVITIAFKICNIYLMYIKSFQF